MSANRGFRWNPESQQFDLVDLDGRPIANIRNGVLRGLAGFTVSSVGSVADARVQRLILGDGATMSFAHKSIGTMPAIAVASAGKAVITLAGSIACVVGDWVGVTFGTTPGVGPYIGGARVVTTNTVVCDMIARADMIGSQDITGAHVMVWR